MYTGLYIISSSIYEDYGILCSWCLISELLIVIRLDFLYDVAVICFFFFFSSRRRHTRWNCDWSSDVCSSDLGEHRAADQRGAVRTGLRRRARRRVPGEHRRRGPAARRDGRGRAAGGRGDDARSEERRVGKECRGRGAPQHGKKKRRVSGDRIE